MRKSSPTMDVHTRRLLNFIYADAGVGDRLENYRRIWKRASLGMLFIQITMFFSLIVFSFSYDLVSLPVGAVANVAMDGLIVAVLTLMLQSAVRSEVPDRTTVAFLLLIFFGSMYVYLDGFSWIVNGNPTLRTLNAAINYLYYLCGIALTRIYWSFLCALFSFRNRITDNATNLINFFTILAALLVLGNGISGYYFTISPDGYYLRTPDTYACSVILPTTILLVCVVLVLKMKTNRKEKLILLFYPFLPYVGALLTIGQNGPSLLSILTFGSVFCIYSNIYVRRERELVQKQVELAETKLNSMLLQINPHFIYNTIGSAASLCHSDPMQAEKMLFAFSGYLRKNFGELANQTIIPFSREIEHLKVYIEIEKMRFPDIEVSFDLQVTDFDIASLSVQPLVENAITHGIMGKESGGSICISSYEDEHHFYVKVEDDGIGYSPKPKNDGRNHIGIANVRNRLRILCDGELSISGIPGVGTVAQIRIPKEESGNARTMR